MTNEFNQAMELLASDRPSRDEVVRAGELLDAASAGGDGAASERCAMFEAFGMARPQNWDKALDLLALAARQGSRAAQEQLLLLADPSRDPVPPANADEHYWTELRTSLDLARRIDPGQKISLSEVPRLRTIPGFASPAECRWLVSLASERLAPAMVFDTARGGEAKDSSRDNKVMVLRIAEMNVFTEVIRHRISAATRLPVPLFEPAQLLHYSVGERFKPHYDFLDPANPAYAQDLAQFGQRIATFLIYLNDGYEGGATSFPAIGLDHRAGCGDALFFANVNRDGSPDRSALHAGMPPTSGEKWVLSQWIRDRLPAA
jgi:hypothetical protein